MQIFRIFNLAQLLAVGAIALAAGTASAQPKPFDNPDGTFSGTIDGHTFELPVVCLDFGSFIDISSHDQTIQNSTSIGGVEPAVSIFAMEQGFQLVVFVGGERYKILRARDTIEAYPYSMAREVRASKIGKVEIDFTVDCPALGS